MNVPPVLELSMTPSPLPAFPRAFSTNVFSDHHPSLHEKTNKRKIPEEATWTVDTKCPDTTFVVFPDVVTHLTSEVLVVKGDPDAASFEYSLYSVGVDEEPQAVPDEERVWQQGDLSGVIHLHNLEVGG